MNFNKKIIINFIISIKNKAKILKYIKLEKLINIKTLVIF
jgi:hypothetical protein